MINTIIYGVKEILKEKGWFMFIIKNAWRNIMRAKGRSVLIGIIVTMIAFSACIGLCIRQSAQTARTNALNNMTITAEISPDREKAMEKSADGGRVDPSKMGEAMAPELSLEELEKYKAAEAVKDFYYSLSASLNASGNTKAYSTSNSESAAQNAAGANAGNTEKDGKPSRMAEGDFAVTGYSSDTAMTDFTNGNYTITSGKMFEQGKADNTAVISDELASYNNVKVGDSITLCNPNNTAEQFTLKISGIYHNENASSEAQGGGRGMRVDPANRIFTSYQTLKAMTDASAKTSGDNALNGRLTGTYVVGDVAGYENFKNQVKTLGLSDQYTVNSSDLMAYERQAAPLNNLSNIAGYGLIVLLVLGAVVLVVMNIFSTRERKYEIGVMSAIGMKKHKLAMLFVSEILMITLIGSVIGGGIGAAVSVPVTNALLSAQTASDMGGRGGSFGRDINKGPGQTQNNGGDAGSPQTAPGGSGGSSGQRITQVESAVNLTVLIELLGISLLLAMASGMVSVIFITRYDPITILSERD